MLTESEIAELVKPVFKSDHTGKPVPTLDVREIPTRTREIKTNIHSLKVLPKLEAIDLAIEKIFGSIVGSYNTDLMLEQAEQLTKHGRFLLSQAFYLDTADRNSFDTIMSAFGYKKDSNQVLGGNASRLNSLWHGKLHEKRESVNAIPALG